MAQGRPGPARSETARRAVLHAAAALLEQSGFDAVTIEGIARGAGVGKQTIYRWYPSKSRIIADALMEGVLLTEEFPVPDTGDVLADLGEWLAAVFRFLQNERNARLMESMLMAAMNDRGIADQLSLRMGGAQPAVLARLDAAITSGAFPSAAPAALASEAIFGTLLMKVLMRGPLRREDAHEIVALVLGRAGAALDPPAPA